MKQLPARVGVVAGVCSIFLGLGGNPANAVQLRSVGSSTTAGVASQSTYVVADFELSSRVTSWLYAILIGIVVIMLVLATIYSARQAHFRQRLAEVLAYTQSTGRDPSAIPDEQKSESFIVFPWIDQLLRGTSFYSKSEAGLDSAQIRLTPGGWLGLRIAAGTVLVLLFAIISQNIFVSLVLGASIGWFTTRLILRSRAAGFRREFESELPDFLMLVASALRSGLSFSQALNSTARDGHGQVSREVRRAISEIQMGSTLEAALLRVADRMDSNDFRWSINALAIQREVGGNLSNILESASEMVQGRAALSREVRTLTAEGRLSAWILAGLPVLVFVYLMLTNPAYVSFFWTETLGQILIIFILILFGLGALWMRSLVRIKV